MRTILNQQKLFQTADISLTATLLTIGFHLQGLDKSNPKRAQFNFLDSENIHKCANAYWSGKVKVNPRLYFDNLKLLKNRLYNNV